MLAASPSINSNIEFSKVWNYTIVKIESAVSLFLLKDMANNHEGT
jgi:hypothetical protein